MCTATKIEPELDQIIMLIILVVLGEIHWQQSYWMPTDIANITPPYAGLNWIGARGSTVDRPELAAAQPKVNQS